ncbi:MAG: 50S ribosomal protein L21 [Candidatus Moranbacteria bacterium RIFCSPHIGHO2_12_FULL_54_9]|nr:MAG: 50S ribosomal protein L21 [Candidatus Moranbacteria bacterium RIFCSPHIGHO2_01_FULL_54_31]OGI24889.1 MAG: 50S ribosomal protein L21 [Candidatus Moranbacteria bacterium RIFCSPHIGHO2_12_FULL_54_9]
MLAIIRTGGKQYKVSEHQTVKIEKLDQEIGATVKFEVLFLGDEKEVHIGTPVLEKAVVEGKVIAQERHKKVTGIKHKPKKRYLVRYGHRQAYTAVEITKISVK